MSNIFSSLRPSRKKEHDFNSLLKRHSLDDNATILWYHSAGRDFKNLYFAGNRKGLPDRFGGKPSLFVYTDMDKDLIDYIENGELFQKSDNKELQVLSYFKLEFQDNVKKYFTPMFTEDRFGFREDGYAVYLIEVKLGEDEGIVPLLYFVWENTAFLKAFVMERNIKIKYMQKPREYGFGGGWIQTQAYLLFFLHDMQAEYLFLEHSSNYRGNLDLIKRLIARDKSLSDTLEKNRTIGIDAKRLGITLENEHTNNEFNSHYDILKLHFRNKPTDKGHIDDIIEDTFRCLII